MANDTVGSVDMMKEADDSADRVDPDLADEADVDVADEPDVDVADEAGTAADDETPPGRRTVPWRWVSAVLLIALVALGLFGYFKYTAVADELAAVHQADADRTAAVQAATDYALKSLTYSFEDPDAFFRTVEEGVSPALKDKYVNAMPLLKGIMLQAQVTSTGEVLATEATAQPGDVYQVVVSASQKTRNLQNPEPRVSITLLQVTMNKVGDTWQVSDIGPKTGTQAANADQIPPVKPGPAPAPKPTPPR